MAPFPMTVSKDKTLLSWKINKECLHGVAVFTSFMQLQTCVPEHTFTSMCYFGDKTRFLRQLFYGIRLRSNESLQRSLACSSGCCCFRVSYPCTNSFLLMAVITSVIGTSAWFFSESRRDWAVYIRAPLPLPPPEQPCIGPVLVVNVLLGLVPVNLNRQCTSTMNSVTSFWLSWNGSFHPLDL